MNYRQPEIRSVEVTRYVSPLREGGSLPAITEADDGFLYVLKFRGAGQGSRALIAEFISGELARAAGLKVPEIVFAELDSAFGRSEGDEEIQDLLRASEGLNLGLHYLSGAITYDPAVDRVDALLASKIVWLDAFLTNVDRTAKNTNMLTWHKELWLIDHGASLYFHHSSYDWEKHYQNPFVHIKNHVLLPQANELEQVDEEMRKLFTPEVINAVVRLVPSVWLEENEDTDTASLKEVYSNYLIHRIAQSDIFVNEAEHAREALI
jgi:hypothetical protein